MERFFDLTLAGSADGQQPAGFTGQITANSFMKKEFGKKLVKEFIAKWDLTHVIDTSGAYIPGHGTPTVILFGRNVKSKSTTVRTVLGIKGEPGVPTDPAQGQVWAAIVNQVDCPGSESEFISAADSPRALLHCHPWSTGGGGAAELKTTIDGVESLPLGAKINVVGVFGMTNCDEVYVVDSDYFDRAKLPRTFSWHFISGEPVRDWMVERPTQAFFPYEAMRLASLKEFGEFNVRLWMLRIVLGSRATFAKLTYFQEGRPWWEWHQVSVERLSPARTITFPYVATHNQFVLESGKAVFNRHAPIIKLSPEATEEDHLRLLGLLNSSAACFWMKQVFHCKGSTVDARGARQTTVPFEDFYEFDGTKLKQFPVVEMADLTLVTAI